MHIVIADDHPLYLVGLEDILKAKRPGISVYKASNINDTISLIQSKYQLLDLLIIDRSLSGVDSLDYISDIKKSYPKLKIAVISAWDSQPYIVDAINSGACGFIPKTFSGEKLDQAITNILQLGTFIPKLAEATKNDINLNSQELTILRLISRGMLNKQIAEELNIEENNVKQKIYMIYKKMNVKTRTQAIQKANLLHLI
jgi:DNA-binding NarL/FixJ family response regulator